jgi:phosphoglycolate phosphatase-like HAD superfamily hydrolase
MVGDSPGDIVAGKAVGCIGRANVSASARAAMSRMQHGDATHDINNVEDLHTQSRG